MTSRSAGRPREFDRDDAIREAARLFWKHGFSGTSTRALSSALGIAGSSLYAAFGSKAGLFDEAVRSYALRYSAVYDAALAEPTLERVLARVLLDSAREFGRADEGHPGCLTSSAVMADASATLDVREFVTGLQRRDQDRLLERIERDVRSGDVVTALVPAALAGLVQTLWHGLAARADLGAGRDELVAAAEAAAACLPVGPRAEPAARRTTQGAGRGGSTDDSAHLG